MSMSTHVIGFRPPDETWRKMKEVWDTCKAADVPVPADVERFFDGCRPDDRGIEVSLGLAAKPYSSLGEQGVEIELAALPTNITHIRFYNSY